MQKILGLVVALLLLCAGCGGVSASTATYAPVDSAQCYQDINEAVRGDWAGLTKAQRALVGIKSIQICEGEQP